ncbi:MAG: ornithine carbamoyltransferase [Candidatus Nitrohelix vancouverensis]|uniref:Ornithine carbamoyltransferase n=1 Tax=Candidatus Nitrohelix vancouverensis TaxID=2705534 RepID=A0A7T0G4R7_9BACT|nr:MAG: ornithine carbamoyltransferase [Candidatus Nitrohelix vancouverensis]
MKRDFLVIEDLNRQEILDLFKRTVELKKDRQKNIPHPTLKGKSLGMIFYKNSTRTRISFEVGMFELGGQALYLTSEQLQLERGETIEDSARVLSRYLHGIMIRTYDFKLVEQLAKHASIPVINGLTDKNHPIQVLCDLFTIQERLGKIEGFTLTYVGDDNNMSYSWMEAAALLDFQLRLALPENCSEGRMTELASRDNIQFFTDPAEAAKDADILYTDVWVSMGAEDEADEKRKSLKAYQINQKLIDLAKPNALVMHCLPAHRGEEITGDALDGENSIVFDQAENRLHLQKALLEKLLSASQ